MSREPSNGTRKGILTKLSSLEDFARYWIVAKINDHVIFNILGWSELASLGGSGGEFDWRLLVD
jgi:hypothetical protein